MIEVNRYEERKINTKKKLLLTLLALAAVLSLSGCADGTKEQTATTTTTKSAGEKIGDGIGDVIDGIGELF